MKADTPAPSRFNDRGIKGPCDRDTKRCAAAKHYQSPTPACCLQHIRDLVDHFAGVADELGVTWWADYGTLLGAVRNQGIIPHDKDADLGVDADGFEALLNFQPDVPWEDLPNRSPSRRIRIRELHGFQWYHKLERPNRSRRRFNYAAGNSLKVFLSTTNRTNVDIFPWYENESGVLYRKGYVGVDRFKGKEFHRDRLYPLQQMEWEHRTVPVPAYPEWFCRHRYGKDWQTPLHANNDRVRRT